MKLKYVVGAVMILFALFMFGVFIWGFASKLQNATGLNNTKKQVGQTTSSSLELSSVPLFL
ncbi:hypothetical protein HYX70_03745 [Candidatus Saccharibacteria bacterium]|nr:hypothetical protein [Candidatus Saccharibacteria bacterium]